MVSSDFRREARNKLSGKWKKVFCITIIYMLLFSVLNYLGSFLGGLVGLLFSIALLVVEIPLAFGLSLTYYNIFKGKDMQLFDFCTLGFNNFALSWKIVLRTILRILIPVVLMIVSIMAYSFGLVNFLFGSSFGGVLTVVGGLGFIASTIWFIINYYYYAIANFVAFDDLSKSSQEIIDKSKKLMTNNRKRLFMLQLSFIGWAILAALAASVVGMIFLGNSFISTIAGSVTTSFVIIYLQFATIAFYMNLKGEGKTEPAKVAEKTSTIEEPIKTVEPEKVTETEENSDNDSSSDSSDNE